MTLHVVAGALALASGSLALIARKGSAVHRLAGRVFVIGMLTGSAAGAWIAYRKPEAITLLVGLFTIHLVSSAWLTVRGTFERHLTLRTVSVVAALALVAAFLHGALAAWTAPSGTKDGFPAPPYLFFAALALLSATLDARRIVGPAPSAPARVLGHLWRMGLALSLATASFFGGPGAAAFPPPLRDSPLLLLPQLAVVALTLYWIVRARRAVRTR